MLHTKFQASKPSGSEEENFLTFFSMYSLWFEPRIPWQGAILDPWTSFEQIGKGLLGNATYPISSI